MIALTGNGPDDRTRSADMGFDAHLVKPVSPGEMRDALTVYGRVDEGPIAVRVS